MSHSTHLICAHQSVPNLETPQIPSEFTPLRLVQQPGKVILVLSQPKIVLGRHSLADVRLMLPYVSRRHCLFQFVNGHWTVCDLRSLIWIAVNVERILTADLSLGDRISIGGFHFVVQLGPMEKSTEVNGDYIVHYICDSRPPLPSPSDRFPKAA